MNKYEALETMLEKILEQGVDIEVALAEFPELAEELRPLLESAVDVNVLAVPSASADVVRRGRTRLLQHAAQIRDAVPAPRASLFNFRLATAALTLMLVFFVGGTSLVRASNSALPGDGLYAVKRGWENTRFLFADDDETIRLEAEYEDERREEVQKLLDYSRVARVQFEGLVTLLDRGKWEVAGEPVIVSEQTDLDGNIRIGSDVIVSGRTESEGIVFADKITLNYPEDKDHIMPIENPEEDINEPDEIETPEINEEDGGDNDSEDDNEDGTQIPEEDDESDSSDEAETPIPEDSETPEPEETPEAEETPEPDDEPSDDDEADDDEPDDDE